MDLYSKIVEVYPELSSKEFINQTILLCDDGDGIQYLAKWDYDKPIPKGLKLGK